MSADLKPCPWCGGPAKEPIMYNGTPETGCGGVHDCPGTDVLVPLAAWNTRAEGPAPVSAPLDREGVAWTWLAANIGMELSWGDADDAEEGEPCVWRVHRRSGGRNDREWDLIATGATPLEAVTQALALTGQQDQVGLTTPAVLGEPSADALRAGEREALLAEIEDLKSAVIAFAAPWSVQYARDAGKPPGHLFPSHYDLLERCGARMVDFTRAIIWELYI